MASRLPKLDFNDNESALAWLDIFEATCRHNGTEKSKQRDYFLSFLDIEAYLRLKTIVAPKDVSTMSFDDINVVLKDYLTPRKKLVIAERSQFFEAKQLDGECAAGYIQRLRKMSQYCEFDKLSGEEDVVKLKFISGLRDNGIKQKLLEANISKELSLNESVELVKHIEQISSYTYQTKVEASQEQNSNQVVEIDAMKLSSERMITDCRFCGRNHPVRKCPAWGKSCNKCGRKNHFSSKCRSPVRNIDIRDGSGNRTDSVEMYAILRVDNQFKSLYHDVAIGNATVPCMVDTGSAISTIPMNTAIESKLKIQKSNVNAVSYSGTPIQIYGQVINNVGMIFQVVDTGRKAILGMDNLSKIESSLENIIAPIEVCDDTPMVNFHIRPNVDMSGKVLPARALPFSLKPMVEIELKRLLAKGVIVPEESPIMAAPIVPVLKKNEEIRICGDYRLTINSVIDADQYRINTLDEITHALSGCKWYSKLDLKSAYLQLPLSKDAMKFTTISTHIGHFSYTRLPFGISAAPAIFQEFMDKYIVSNTPGVKAFQDDVIVAGETVEQHNVRLNLILERLKTFNLEINKEKSMIGRSAVPFLGYVLDAGVLKPDPHRLDSFKSIKSPENKTQLKSVLGTLRYYGNFLMNFSARAASLYRLLCKDVDFHWNGSHEIILRNLIEDLTQSDLGLHCYDMEQELFLTTDASKDGLGFVLSHDRDMRKIVKIGSTVLSQSQKNYSNIEREAAAIVEGVKYFHQFLVGRKFCLVTDHQPLIRIFSNDKSVSDRVSQRLQRWAMMLRSYNFSISYKRGELISLADCLSRFPATNTLSSAEVATIESRICIMADKLPATLKDSIRHETWKDEKLRKLMKFVVNGWPTYTPKYMLPYSCNRDEYSVEDGFVMRGTAVVVPQNLIKSVIKLFHNQHLGINRTRKKIRHFFWWPKMDAMIGDAIANCKKCQMFRCRKPNASLKSWDEVSCPMERIHVDVAQYKNYLILCLVDTFSSWVDCKIIPSLSTEAAIVSLKNTFKYIGTPVTLVSDNGTNFSSKEFRDFLREYRIQHILTPPHHHQSNGRAERMVQTMKAFLRKNGSGQECLTEMRQLLIDFCVLFNNSPCSNGMWPNKEMFAYDVRTKLKAELEPSIDSKALLRTVGDCWKPTIFERHCGSNTNVVSHNQRHVLVHDSQLQFPPRKSDAEKPEEFDAPAEDVSEQFPGEEPATRYPRRERRPPARLQYE